METESFSPKDIEAIKVYFDLSCLFLLSAAVFIWINITDRPKSPAQQRRDRMRDMQADLFEKSLKDMGVDLNVNSKNNSKGISQQPPPVPPFPKQSDRLQ